MKTTIEIPDELFIAAKATAARRRTTLRDMITRSLRREIGSEASHPALGKESYEIGEHGLPCLKKRPGQAAVTNEMIYKMREDEDV